MPTRSFGLDLLRCLAVTGVVVAHCAVVFGQLLGWVPPNLLIMGAFLGVEAFFVLSGFLIGGLLLDIVATAPTGRSFAIFMARRWLRTLPLYYLWLALLPLLLPIHPPLLPYALMTQNLAWPMPSSFYYGVSWSLAIEEWFYLLFSAALIGAVALARARWPVWPVIAAFILLPAIARQLRGAPPDFSTSIYQVVLYRLDSIAWGVALAKLYRDRWRLFARPALAAGLGVPLVAVVWAEAGTNFLPINRHIWIVSHLFATSLGLSLCLVALLALRRPQSWIAAPIGVAARISYGVYITHLTILEVMVFRMAPHAFGRAATIAATMLLILLVPWLSFRFFEAPILAWRPAQFRKAVMHQAA